MYLCPLSIFKLGVLQYTFFPVHKVHNYLYLFTLNTWDLHEIEWIYLFLKGNSFFWISWPHGLYSNANMEPTFVILLFVFVVLCNKHHNFNGSPVGIQTFHLVERCSVWALCCIYVQFTSDELYTRKQWFHLNICNMWVWSCVQ